MLYIFWKDKTNLKSTAIMEKIKILFCLSHENIEVKPCYKQQEHDWLATSDTSIVCYYNKKKGKKRNKKKKTLYLSKSTYSQKCLKSTVEHEVPYNFIGQIFRIRYIP